MWPYIHPTMPFSVKLSPPPSKAQPSNGSPPFPHTPSTVWHTLPPVYHTFYQKSPISGHTLISPQRQTRTRRDAARLHRSFQQSRPMNTQLHSRIPSNRVCSLITHTSTPDLHELKPRNTYYIRMKEMQNLHTKFCTDYTPSTTAPDKPLPRPNTRPREPRQPRFTRYAPLSVPRSRLLDEALHADLIPPPRKTSNPPMLTWPSTAATTEIMATPPTNAKRSKIKSKNWFAPFISAALSVEKNFPIHDSSITVTPLAVPVTIIGQIHPTAQIHNLPALTSTQLIPPTRHYQHHLRGLRQWRLHLIS